MTCTCWRNASIMSQYTPEGGSAAGRLLLLVSLSWFGQDGMAKDMLPLSIWIAAATVK